MQTIHSAPVPDTFRNTQFYHGTSTETAAASILRSGFIKAPDLTGRKGFLKPVAGRVYLTSSVRLALVYAIGGDMIGVRIPDRFIGDPYGYLFGVNASDLVDVQPDEDVVGSFLAAALNAVRDDGTLLYNGSRAFRISDRFTRKSTDPIVREIWDNTNMQVLLTNYARRLGDRTRMFVADEDIGWMAMAGKTAIRKLPTWALLRMVEVSGTVAHSGDARISSCWRLDKRKTDQLKPDGSNFQQVLEPVPIESGSPNV